MASAVAVSAAIGRSAPRASAQPPPAANPYAATAESIWPGIVRFYPSAEDKSKAPPSLIVQIPPSRFGPPPENPPIVPKFSKDGDRHVATIEIEPGTSLYGAGVVPGPLTLNGRTFIAAPADRDVAPPAENADPARPAPPPGPPPVPPIPLKLIGVLERANGVKWAVLTDGKNAPMYGKDGDIVDGRYQIVKIGTESVEMTYADGRGRTVIRLTGQ